MIRVNAETPDPLQVLGNVLSEYMDSDIPNPHTQVGQEWQMDRDRIVGELELHGLRYHAGGTISSGLRPKQFVAGGLYFMFWYLDPERLCLQPDPLVFLGRNLSFEHEPSERDAWYFQDAPSYAELGPYSESSSVEVYSARGAYLTELRAEDLFQVTTCDGLARRLLEIAKRERAGDETRFSTNSLYYRVRYPDARRLILIPEPLEFVERVADGPSGTWRFKAWPAMLPAIGEEEDSDEEVGNTMRPEISTMDLKDEELSDILNVTGLVKELLECSKRRIQAGLTF